MKSLFVILFSFFFSFHAIAQITGHLQTVIATQSQLSDSRGGQSFGTWSSSNTLMATVGTTFANQGVVTGVATGTCSISYTYNGTSDVAVFRTTSVDSSGYYFVTVNSKKLFEKRDFDGKTITSLYAGNNGNTVNYVQSSNEYQIIFNGWNSNNNISETKTVTIPIGYLKSFDGTPPQSTPDSVVVQILGYGL